MITQGQVDASKVVRGVFATGTVVFFVAGILVRDEPRLFVASGTLGILWWVWDLLVEHFFRPLGDWFFGQLTGANSVEPLGELRPTINDTIRLLESHIENEASEQVCVNAAIRLEEIYRTVKKDAERGREVVEKVRARFPEAEEWERWGGAKGEKGKGKGEGEV